MNEIKKVCDFIDSDVKDYALYVLHERAIPLFNDGLKPSKRKIIYTAFKYGYKKREKKTINLIGNVLLATDYKHGDKSLADSINNLTKNYIPFNNYPLFESSMDFGNRLIPDPPQPRYTSLKLSNNFINFFEYDIDYLDSKNIENEYDYFMPLLPFTLINGEIGVAIGFSCNIYPREIRELIRYIINKIDNKNINTDLIPFYKDFKGEIYKDGSDYKYKINYKKSKNGKKIIIDEIFPLYDREKYVSILMKYKEDKILDFVDECSENPRFIIKFKEKYEDDQIIKMLKLEGKLKNEIITVIKNGVVKTYNNIFEYVDDWADWRIRKYQDRFKYIKNEIKIKAKIIKSKYKFINYCKKNVDFKKVKKEDYDNIIKKLEIEDYKKELLNIPIYKISDEEIDILKNEYKSLKNEYKKYSDLKPEQEYKKELKKLLNFYSGK